MTAFTPETPLGRDVQALLLEFPQGLTLTELLRLLRIEKSRMVSEVNLRAILGHPRVFTSISGDRYVLAGRESQAIKTEPEKDEPVESREDKWSRPFIANLPCARTNYVVFDIETTGTNPESDRIIQIAALKIIDGSPHAIRNWYINPGEVEIPYTLQVKLGLTTNPDILEAIKTAPRIEDVLPRLIGFIGHLPIVAHNARFDASFVTNALNEQPFDNPLVDSLELALLLMPHLQSHQLEQIAQEVGINIDALSKEWAELDIDTNITTHEVSSHSLHNAITDVYVLYRTYTQLLEKMNGKGATHYVLSALLPEAFADKSLFKGVEDDLLGSLRSQCNWAMNPNESFLPITTPSAEQVLTDYLASKARQPRAGQLEMQQMVNRAVAEGHYTMIEAPTGTGKTLAYLTAAVHQALRGNTRIALSTAYRNLQDQLLEEIGDFNRYGKVKFRSQLLKGVSNYICWSQFSRYIQEGDPRNGKLIRSLTLVERFVLAYVALRLPASKHGTLDELNYWLLERFPVARAVVHQLRATAACDPNLQPSCSACPMPAAYKNAREADIVIINHALWLADPQRMPPFAHLILDEAHTLEDVATNALTEEVSEETMSNLINHLFDQRTERGLLPRIRASTTHGPTLEAAAGAISASRQARLLVEDFGQFLVQFIRRCAGRIDAKYGASYRLEAAPEKIHGPRWQRVEDAHYQLFGLYLSNLIEALDRLLQASTEAADLRFANAIRRELVELRDELSKQRKLAHELVRVNDQNLVYWVEVGPPLDPSNEERDPKPKSWAFKAAPIDVGRALQPFYEALASVSLVSATLALRGNDFSFFIERLGLSERLESRYLRKLPPALPYAQRVFLGLADYFTYAPLEHTIQSFKEELANELTLLLHFTDGRALGLFTARERMESVASRIKHALAQHGIPLYVQTPDSSRRRLLEEFRAREESVLFGLRSFWEGVDAPGATLSFVLMEKLPFPLLIAPVHRARAEELARRGKSEFEDYMLPLMLLQFKQGFGRLMRREDDCGAVILFDKRIHRKPYKADLLNSLPGFLPRDAQAERSRPRFYRAIAELFPSLIDVEAKANLLASLPEDLLLNFEAILQRYQLPEVIPHEEYDSYRPTLLAALKALFGIDQFRLIGTLDAQEQVIRHILAGEDVLGVLPTGAGKSLTFQLPALLRKGVTLVFSPLIALMKDQVAGLNERGIEIVGAIYSGQSASEREDVLERMRRGRARLVYIAPERLRDPRLLEALSDTKIRQVVVDEAHCVYMWGPSFRPDFLYLPRLFDALGYRPPIAALTATATPEMQQAVIEALRLNDPVCVIAPIDRPELQFIVYNARSRYLPIRSRNDRLRTLLRILRAADCDRPSILIYVATTVEADQLARLLRIAGYDARAYHGKMDPAERASVQELFMDDHINMVVCTKAFGMGIDKANIRYVIHYQMPGDLESYFQEAGRAGRDRNTAYCILLYHSSDIKTQEFFIEHGTPDEQTINLVLQDLVAVPGNTLYVDPEQMQDRIGLEEVQLRVALHHLEAQGYLRRSTDFTLSGALTFQITTEEAVANWRSDADPDADLLACMAELLQWPAFRKTEVSPLSIARALGVLPSDVDRLLLRLSSRREAIYQPWRRGFALEKTDKMGCGAVVPAGALAANQHREQLRYKLVQMVGYAERNEFCRRATVLDYFGQREHAGCAGCDVCRPDQKWPWSLESSQDYATPDAYIDPAFLILEAAYWNLRRADRYRAPYGTGTLLAILKGDLFTATRFENDPHLKQWRIGQLRSCPHWGALSLLRSRDRIVTQTVERLIIEGYIARAEHKIDEGIRYEFLALTQKGTDQLISGRLLQWGMK
jgi:ATP-dependent DNA helicase RecQ